MAVRHGYIQSAGFHFYYIILSYLFSYFTSTIDVGSEPDRYVGTGTGFCPPGFAGNGGWIGGDAGFTTFHITENPNSIFCASLIWVKPISTCFKDARKKITEKATNQKCLNNP